MGDQLNVRKIDYPALEAAPRAVPRPAVHGAISPLSYWTRSVPRFRDEVIAGFRSQEIRIHIDGRQVMFTAADVADPFPFEHPVLLLSGSVHDNESRDPGVDHLPAVALAADRQWVDQVYVVRDGGEGWAAARRLGGRFLVRWSEQGASLVDTTTQDVLAHWQMRGRTLTHRCCPLIPDAVPGDLCKMHGGPWISMSIIAAGNWNARRALFLDELGCDEACRYRPKRRTRIPTRYDTWLPEEAFSQPERHNEQSVAVVEPIVGTTVIREADGRSWEQRVDEPVVLSRGRIVEVGCRERDVTAVLSRMCVDPTGGGEQVLDWEDAPRAWRAMDADLAHRFRGLGFVHRWAAVGRVRITGVNLGGEVFPLAFDLRGPGLLLPVELARFGACGMGEAHGWRLGQVEALHGGYVHLDRRTGSGADAVADWLREERLAHLAAMFLEPLDADGALTLLERQRYYDHLIGVLGDARLGVDADGLRSALLDSGDYLRAQAAMADPRSDEAFWAQVSQHADRFGTREVFRLI